MRVQLAKGRTPVLGADVVVGNVYANNRAPAFRDFRIVIGIVDKANGRHPWNKVVFMHVDAKGNVVGVSRQPIAYVKDHWDLVGKVVKMPTLKIEWNE